MINRGLQGFVLEVLWQPIAGVWALPTGLLTFLTWFSVGEQWTDVTKISVTVSVLLFALLTRVLYVAYPLYTQIDLPLRVRRVSQGKSYYQDNLIILLERRDAVSVGDILALFVCEGDTENPLCLISVESITSENYPQCVVFPFRPDKSLFDYLIDESRQNQLHAKRSITRRHLENV